MGLVNAVFCGIGKCFDVFFFLLDLNFIIVHSVIRVLSACIAFLNTLPVLLTNLMVGGWNLTLFFMVALIDGISLLAEGTVNIFWRWLNLLAGVLESFKLIGYFSAHVFLRIRDVFHGLLRQVWEGCGIALSLLLYLVNTVVNLLLIGTQNLYTIAVSMWETVSYPLQKAVELTLTLVTFLYSSLVGTSVILWTPFRLALELLGLLGHVFLNAFVLNIYGLVALATVVAVVVYKNPEFTRRAADRANSFPALRRLRAALRRFYLLERGLWRGLQRRLGRLHQAITEAYRSVRARADRGRQPEPGVREPRAPPDGRAGDTVPRAEPAGRPHQLMDDLWDLVFPGSSSTDRPLRKQSPGEGGPGPKGRPGHSLMTLLKEQEEKKCVICQDSAKTVVLLPCRHLCLCRGCANILQRQPLYQQTCPLCRHMILNTMDVFL